MNFLLINEIIFMFLTISFPIRFPKSKKVLIMRPQRVIVSKYSRGEAAVPWRTTFALPVIM